MILAQFAPYAETKVHTLPHSLAEWSVTSFGFVAFAHVAGINGKRQFYSMHYNEYRKVVHAILFHKGKVLLSRRLKKGFHQGFWGDPGGKMEIDERPVHAIQRELLEETDLYLPVSSLLFLDCYIYPRRKVKCFVFVSILTRTQARKIKNTEPDKHSDWQWFSIKEALALNLLPSVRYVLETYKE